MPYDCVFKIYFVPFEGNCNLFIGSAIKLQYNSSTLWEVKLYCRLFAIALTSPSSNFMNNDACKMWVLMYLLLFGVIIKLMIARFCKTCAKVIPPLITLTVRNSCDERNINLRY